MRVLVCDDHCLFAESFAFLLTSRGHEVVGCVASPGEAVRLAASSAVDVCVMDLHFPGDSGLDAITRVIEASPTTRVLVLTGSSEPLVLTAAVNAGAHGIAVKDYDVYRVIDTLERVHAGECVIEAQSFTVKSEVGAPGKDNGAAQFLTEREREVLEHLVQGTNIADLAKAMKVSHSTARTHIQKVLTKLGVHSKLEAVAYAVNNRIVIIPHSPPPSSHE